MRKLRERSLRLESLEDRMLLAVTAGGAEIAAAACVADPLPTAATQLATPTNLDATCAANNTLNVSWDAVANASSYTIYYQNAGATLWKNATSTTNSFTIRGLNASNAYDIKVVAVGDGTNYTNSEESDVITRIPSTSVSTVVTTLDDIRAVATPTGEISFRQAVYFASRTGQDITFADGLEGTVDLATYGQIQLTASSRSFTVVGDNRITLTNSGTRAANRLFYYNSSAQTGFEVTFNDLTISGCSVTAGGEENLYGRGGAIMVWNTAFGTEGDPYVAFTLNNCTVTGNSAVDKGGFFYAYGGSLTANNCTFTGNTATEGGAISTLAGDVFLTDSTFTENSAVGTGSASGGAVSLDTYYASTIDNCAFTNNSAKISSITFGSNAASGGALYLTSGSKADSWGLVVTDTVFSENIATCADGQDYCDTACGGAVYAQNAGARFYNCSITGNSAELGLVNYGGGVATEGTYDNNSSQQLFFFMTDLSNNYIGYKDGDIWGPGGSHAGGAANCPSQGGAVYAKGIFHMVNCTVTDNVIYASKANNNISQKSGAALFIYSNAVLYDTTVAGNRVVGSNANVNFDNQSAAIMIYGGVTMKTSAILGNYYEDTDTGAKTDCDIYSHAWMLTSPNTSLQSCVYNPNALYKDSSADWGSQLPDDWNYDFSYNCIAVTDYEAFFNDYAAGDYTLAADSPAIDASDSGARIDFGYEYDIRYYLNGEECYRIVNGVPDIGAYEYQTSQTFEVTIEDYVGVYDGAEHTITVSDLEPGDVVYYSEDGVSYDTAEIAYTDPGTYTIYVKVERAGYEDFLGSGTVTITEASTKLNVAVVVSASAATATELEVLPDSVATATVGDTLYAQVWILNADNSAAGCTGGYIDLSYTDGVLAKGSYTASSIYASQATMVDDSTAGLVACFGGCTQAGVNDKAVSQWALLGTYTFTASVEGTAEVAAGLPTSGGVHVQGMNLARAGEGVFADSELDFGSVTFTVEAGGGEQLAAPVITTGNRGVYVSYGANRHLIQWGAVANASGYEVGYTVGGSSWETVQVTDVSAVITALAYGTDVTYQVRALGTGSYTDSEWSASKTFNVCPMDINNDGDISGSDRNLLANSWLSEEGDDEYQYYADINGDGDVSGADRNFISNNWLSEAGDDDLTYPRPLAADAVFAAYEAGDLDVDFDVF